MNVLDLILILLVLAYAISGYWQGFVTGAFATTGLLLGGFFGIWLVPLLLEGSGPSLAVSLGALFLVILCATLGQALFQYAGAKVRDSITWQPVRAVDAVGGSALSAVAVLVVAWALGVAVAGSSIGSITPLVRESTILAKVDQVLPDKATEALNAFSNVVGNNFFPRYLEPFAPERIVAVDPPDSEVGRDPDVVDAAQSVLKIHGANKCGRGVEGTGFVYGPERLMTNAHVVAGVSEPEVFVGDERLDATVVYYNKDLDVAVLQVPGLERPRLDFEESTEDGQSVAILGYPNDGPYDVQPGRIRSDQRLRSPDIYGTGTVVRDVYSLRALIRPGNSGGPVVNTAGDVVGVVFAASVTDEETGYALTASAVRSAAAEGLGRTDRVDTGDCAG
ncbi:MarP family serine protease [Nocardioides sp. AE5]|uniref:MarP family serine protease n=1 Tax=Nocardioides sp. AE5 TaxID=2962573 RepID=UPI0028817076|nr:MarP family serine protease [Nocardioides sp. AE5]MDT0200533.1 MarP family serine protease [Nocardioides sp. AE5]